MKRHVLVAVALCAGILSVAGAKEASSCKIRVACIGDSITWGYAMTNRVRQLAK